MTSVGSYEAKTLLPQLLARVARGEKILITRRGQAVAMLVPAAEQEPADLRAVIRALKDLRKGNVLGDDLSVRDLINEGRRF